MGPGPDRTRGRPLDLQSDSHLWLDTLPNALRGPVLSGLVLTFVLLISLMSNIPLLTQLKSICKHISSYQSGKLWILIWIYSVFFCFFKNRCYFVEFFTAAYWSYLLYNNGNKSAHLLALLS